jgi:predicted permease
LGSTSARVVGIAPPGFHGVRVGADTDVWILINSVPRILGYPAESLEIAHMTFYARLRPGISVGDAQSEWQRTLQGATGSSQGRNRYYLRRLTEARYPAINYLRFADDQQLGIVVLVVSGLLLLVGVLNLASLESAYFLRRHQDFGIRLALGATLARIRVQHMKEAIITGLCGAVLAWLVATWSIGFLGRYTLPSGLSIQLSRPQLTWPLLALGVVISVLMTCGARLAPLLRASSLNSEILTSSSRPETRAPIRSRVVLLLTHASLSVVLLTGALLCVRTVLAAFKVDLGFSRASTLELVIQPRFAQYAWRDADASGVRPEVADLRRLLSRLIELPGVSASAHGPLPFQAAPAIARATQGRRRSLLTRVGPGYATASGLRLIAGRDLRRGDESARPVPVLISESFASEYWPNTSPVGETFIPSQKGLRGSADPLNDPFEVVGVVSDAVRFGLRGSTWPVVYQASPIDGVRVGSVMLSIVVQASGGASTVIPAAQSLTREVLRDFNRLEFNTADDFIDQEIRVQRLISVLFSGLAFLALLLVAVGVSGMVASAVASRRREIGIRRALGAPRLHLLIIVGQTGIWPVLAGAIGGVLAALGLRHTIAAYLFGVDSVDVLSYGGATALLMLTASLASLLAARRALFVDPADVLRDI